MLFLKHRGLWFVFFVQIKRIQNAFGAHTAIDTEKASILQGHIFVIYSISSFSSGKVPGFF